MLTGFRSMLVGFSIGLRLIIVGRSTDVRWNFHICPIDARWTFDRYSIHIRWISLDVRWMFHRFAIGHRWTFDRWSLDFALMPDTCLLTFCRCSLAVVFRFTRGMPFVSCALTIDFAAALRAGFRRLTSAKAMRSTNGGPCRPRLCGDSMGPF